MSTLREVVSGVPGLRIWHEVISPEYEQSVIREIDASGWSNELSRRTAQLGWSYNYKSGKSTQLHDRPITGKLLELVIALKQQVGVTFDRIICNEYTRKQGITPHTDSGIFGPVVAGLSLLGGANMVFDNPTTGEVKTVWLPPRSLLLMTGESREVWRHSIPAKVGMIDDTGRTVRRGDDYRRVSITFRNAK